MTHALPLHVPAQEAPPSVTCPGSGGDWNLPVPDSWCAAAAGGFLASHREHTARGDRLSNAGLHKHFFSYDSSAGQACGDESRRIPQGGSSESGDAACGADGADSRAMQRQGSRSSRCELRASRRHRAPSGRTEAPGPGCLRPMQVAERCSVRASPSVSRPAGKRGSRPVARMPGCVPDPGAPRP